MEKFLRSLDKKRPDYWRLRNKLCEMWVEILRDRKFRKAEVISSVLVKYSINNERKTAFCGDVAWLRCKMHNQVWIFHCLRG